MSSTWRDVPDQSGAKGAKRRLGRRSGVRRASLALPAVVMSVLGVAFFVWFLIGAPAPGASSWQAGAISAIRAPVQPPQIAAAPAMADSRAPAPMPAPELTVASEPEPSRIDAAAIMPVALQPTRQVSTPAAMMAVVNEPEHISAPLLSAPAQPERRASPPPPPLAPSIPQAAPAPQQRQATRIEAKPAPQKLAATEQTDAEDAAEKPAPSSFAIVLARSETEAAARAQLGPLKQKFGSQLGGRRLSYHRVKEGQTFVWRVRSAGLSEADATEICEKIENAGGACSAVAQ